MRAILSLQSQVVYGHVGSSAATYPLQRLGFDVWSLPTVVFSSHAGYPGFRGRKTPITTLRELLRGLDALSELASCEAVISGYLGRPEVLTVALDAAARVKAANPAALYVCDPVLGDDGELYVDAAIPQQFLERAVPQADLVTPNRFELGWLTGMPVDSVAEAVSAVDALRAAGAREVVAKGLVFANQQHVVATSSDGTWIVRAPHRKAFWAGAGDVFTALITAGRLDGLALSDAALRATRLMHVLIEQTHEVGAQELRVIGVDWTADPPGNAVTIERLR